MNIKNVIFILLGFTLLAVFTTGSITYTQTADNVTENSFSNVPDSTLIIGTWVSATDSKLKIVFFKNGIEKDYYNGKLTNTYRWSLKKGKTPSGMTMFSLIERDINSGKEVHNYMAGIGKKYLELVSQMGGHISRITFKRQ